MSIVPNQASARHRLPPRVASSCIDRLMWTTFLGDPVGGQMPILIHFRGRMDEERLGRAFDLTVEAEPILGYALVGHPDHPYWRRVDERDRGPVFEVSEGDADRELLEFMSSPLLTERAPQLRARLFRCEDDVLCIKFNHILMDGGGVGQYLALLSSCYRALERYPGYRPPVRMPDRQGPRRALREAGLLSTLRSLPSIRAPPPTLAVPMRTDDKSRQAFVVRHLGPERLDVLRSYARRNGATINDVLYAAMVRSVLTTLEAPPSRRFGFEVPVDLRKVVPCGAGSGVCNLSGMYYLSIDHRPNEAFKSTLSRVHRQIEAQKAARTAVGEMLFLEMALAPGASLVRQWMERTPDRAFHPYLSNLGVVDPTVVDFGPVPVGDVRYFSTIIHPPVLGIAVSTLGQRMTLTHRYYSLATEPTVMDGFLDRFIGELPGVETSEPEGSMSSCDASCCVEWPTSLHE